MQWKQYQDRRASRDQVEQWLTEMPDACWAVVCGTVSDLLVLDFDGADGESTREALALRPHLRTPSGGSHVYLELPPFRVVGGARVDHARFPGMDIRSDGQLATFFGTRNGVAYRRTPRRSLEAWDSLDARLRHLLAGRRYRDIPMPSVPADFADFEDANELVRRAVERVRRNEASRNDAGFALACGLRDERYDFDGSWPEMQRFTEAVEHDGTHQYRSQEAYDSLVSAFSWPARLPWRLQLQEGRDRFRHTDVGNAERLITLHGDQLRYVAGADDWLVWDGRQWLVDRSHRVEHLAKLTVRAIYGAVANEPDEDKRKRLAAHAHRSEDATRIAKMVKVARSEPAIQVRTELLDADPWKLNLENGTLNLQSGELAEHDRHDLITKVAPVAYNPAATAPTWTKFLREVIPDDATRAAVQSAIGYSLTGDVSAHAIFLLYGTGANGKSVFLNAIRDMLGDYGQQAPTDVLLRRRPGGATNDLARLRGARFVAASETEVGARIAENVVKQLTGGDRLVARHLYAEYVEFEPTAKFWVGTNNKPRVEETSDAIWRRLRLIPFTVTIPPERRDPQLAEKLRAERPGILNWALEGARAFFETRQLLDSEEIRAAVSEYRSSEDEFGRFLNEACVQHPRTSATAAEIYDAYQDWCAREGVDHPWAKNRVGRELGHRAFRRRDVGRNKTATWYGLRLKREDEA